MRLLIACGLTVLAVSVTALQRAGVCPPSSGLAGICMFDPQVNCLDDSECNAGFKCCSEGCNRICKKALGVTEKTGECPPPSGMMGLCVFIPGVSCQSDSECAGGKKCCREGCGKICKSVT